MNGNPVSLDLTSINPPLDLSGKQLMEVWLDLLWTAM